MKVKQLRIQGYRNYRDQSYQAHPCINMFVGPNGAGKTNFLDAVYYAALGRSYFASRDKDVLQSDASFMRLDYQIELDDEVHSVVFRLIPQKGKTVTWDDRPIERMSQYAGKVRIVMMAPQDAFSLLVGNTERRRWLDQLLCQSDQAYAQALRVYNQLLKRRNEYLRQTDRSQLQDSLLDTYWMQMLAPAEYIFEARKALLGTFGKKVTSVYEKLAMSGESVRLDYHSVLMDKRWEDCINAFRKQEYFTGTTAQGIHKDRIDFEINDQNLKHYGSQGQIKSFIIALKMAEFDYLSTSGEFPILLIDDVFAKLDADRIERFFRILDELQNTQIFVSDTDRKRMRALLDILSNEGKIMEVSNGKLIELYEEE